MPSHSVYTPNALMRWICIRLPVTQLRQTFTNSLWHRFRVLQLPADSETNYTSIPVPSKLYSTVPPEQAPLKGYRFTIPDSMSLKGIPTTLSSSAWHDLHDSPADATAAFAKRLIDLGATIVGKTKSSQFGSGREWTDVPSPKNPREDGHQDPAGGATGAASSLAGYEWLRATTGIACMSGYHEKRYSK